MDKQSYFQLNIECKNKELAEIIAKSLEPENSLLKDNTKITIQIVQNTLSIQIESTASISSLRYTVDDILHTISLIENTYEAIKS